MKQVSITYQFESCISQKKETHLAKILCLDCQSRFHTPSNFCKSLPNHRSGSEIPIKDKKHVDGVYHLFDNDMFESAASNSSDELSVTPGHRSPFAKSYLCNSLHVLKQALVEYFIGQKTPMNFDNWKSSFYFLVHIKITFQLISLNLSNLKCCLYLIKIQLFIKI